jgi:hypothetical protein
LEDTGMTMMMKVTEGNLGALKVLGGIMMEGKRIDPYTDPILIILNIDSMGLYGHRIWMLYRYVCKQNLSKTIAVLRAWQLGLCPEAVINHAIDNRGSGLDLEELCGKVKAELPNFVID